MRSAYGNHVESMRKAGCKDCVHSSTEHYLWSTLSYIVCVEGNVIRRFTQMLRPHLSLTFFRKSPLFEHTFYPVSTASIIKTTKLIS